MKKLQKTSYYFLMFLLLISCGQRKGQDIKTEQITEPYFEEELQATRDSAKLILNHFFELMDEEKFEEALDFYLSEEGAFLVAIERSTDYFEFNIQVIIPMLFEYKDESFAYEKAIRTLELSMLATETIILFSHGNNIPSHYNQLLCELAMLYTEVKQYDKALELTDKMLNNIEKENETTLARSRVYYNKAFIYVDMKDRKSALDYIMKAIVILERLQMQDTEDYKNCMKLLSKIEAISE